MSIELKKTKRTFERFLEDLEKYKLMVYQFKNCFDLKPNKEKKILGKVKKCVNLAYVGL